MGENTQLSLLIDFQLLLGASLGRSVGLSVFNPNFDTDLKHSRIFQKAIHQTSVTSAAKFLFACSNVELEDYQRHIIGAFFSIL